MKLLCRYDASAAIGSAAERDEMPNTDSSTEHFNGGQSVVNFLV